MDKDSFFLSKGKIFASFTSGVLAGRSFCGGGRFPMPRCGSGFSGGHSRGALARDLLPMAALATVQLDAADGLRRLPACGPAAHGMVSPPAASFAASPARGRRVCTPGRPSIPLISGPLKKNGVREAGRRRAQKKGELLASHRYNHIPLLDSSPGGFCRSWSCKTHPGCKSRNIFLSLQKNWRNA